MVCVRCSVISATDYAIESAEYIVQCIHHQKGLSIPKNTQVLGFLLCACGWCHISISLCTKFYLFHVIVLVRMITYTKGNSVSTLLQWLSYCFMDGVSGSIMVSSP
jgi:hypothetical protein